MKSSNGSSRVSVQHRRPDLIGRRRPATQWDEILINLLTKFEILWANYTYDSFQFGCNFWFFFFDSFRNFCDFYRSWSNFTLLVLSNQFVGSLIFVGDRVHFQFDVEFTLKMGERNSFENIKTSFVLSINYFNVCSWWGFVHNKSDKANLLACLLQTLSGNPEILWNVSALIGS